MTPHRSAENRVHELVRLGDEGIAGGDEPTLDSYYSPDFVLHGPDGDRGLAETKAFFSIMRSAFPDLTVSRSEIVDRGNLLAVRSVMAGTFSQPFPSAYGELAPTGRSMRLEIIGIMRFNANEQLAEEWLQYDALGFLKQLGLELIPNR